jgi:hypothetical protein
MDFNKLIDYSSSIYYSDIVLLFVEVITLIIIIRSWGKNKLAHVFAFYVFTDLVISIIDELVISISIKTSLRKEILYKGNVVVSLIELIVYYYYFSKIIRSSLIIRILKYFLVLYFILALVFFVTNFNFWTDRIGYSSYLLGALEFLFLLIPSFAYYKELLSLHNEGKLFDRPSFWIVTGVFFFALISIPYYLIQRYLKDIVNFPTSVLVAALFYTPFILNLFFIIRAFICKKELTI